MVSVNKEATGHTFAKVSFSVDGPLLEQTRSVKQYNQQDKQLAKQDIVFNKTYDKWVPTLSFYHTQMKEETAKENRVSAVAQCIGFAQRTTEAATKSMLCTVLQRALLGHKMVSSREVRHANFIFLSSLSIVVMILPSGKLQHSVQCVQRHLQAQDPLSALCQITSNTA